jgi:predicted acyltransferase
MSTATTHDVTAAGSVDPAAPAAPAAGSPVRLASIDAFRGLVLLLMMGEAVRFCAVAAARPASAVWAFLCHHQEHVPWVGCSLHDLIQPGFSFLVGAALPYSLSARAMKGQGRGAMVAHAFRRALILVLLGVFLRSLGHSQTYWTFEDTLTQIGLGYGFLFMLGLRPRREQWIAAALILAAFWLAFALYPVPGTGFDWQSVGVPKDWPQQMSGFEGHWNKGANLAEDFDRWFLNLFPRERAFAYNEGSWSTLSFVPTLATMILGLLAGGVLRSERTGASKLRWLVTAGVSFLAAGGLVHGLGLCPIIKRIWTPSFALWTGGWCFLFLAFFYWALDLRRRRGLAFPLLVLGTNSIAAYVMNWVFVGPTEAALVRHFGRGPFDVLGADFEATLVGASALLVTWLVLLWMQKRKIFIRI